MKTKLPTFETEEQERDFWSSHDSTEYVDWEQAQTVSMPHLKPSVQTISLQLPESILDGLKTLANKWDVSYQELLKIFLAERLKKELG
ncbi:MAG: BrnA antitoxin family protein [Candidatus Parabeggiatoa sp.]|nr:BrnA antitoxin family protein [Candidatus Parabeggiatoa sp.]